MSYYSGESGNIIQTLVDCTFDLTTMICKSTVPFWLWLFDGWIQPNKPDMKKFINNSKITNQYEDKPQLIKIYNSNKGTVYKYSCPIYLSLKDFEKYHESLEIYMRHPIEMRALPGYIEIEVVTKCLERNIPYHLPNIKEDIKIPVGESLNGTEYVNFKNEPHLLITGITGSGKSITLRSMITSINSQYENSIELILIDFKVVELSIFKTLNSVKSYTSNVEDAKLVIKNALDECHERYKKFDEIGVTNIYDYNNKVSKEQQMKYQFIVIEEFVMLLTDKKKVAMTMLKQLSCLARASGQFLIITAQRFDNTVIDIVLRSQIGNRLCHKVETEADSKLILDTTGAEKLRGNGHMILKQGSKRTELQGYYISEEQVRKIFNTQFGCVLGERQSVPVYNNDKNVGISTKQNSQLSSYDEDKIVKSIGIKKSKGHCQSPLKDITASSQNGNVVEKLHDNLTDLSFLDRL